VRPRALRIIALAALSACVLVTCAWPAPATAQSPRAGLPVFDGTRAYEHVRQMVAIGPRPAGSAAIAETRRYLGRQLAACGLTAIEQTFEADTPRGRVPMVNLRVVLPGTSRTRLLIAGHYDTKRFDDVRFLGANDGGSSAALLLELARVLAPRPRTATIELVFFDGEEAVVEWGGTDRTYGSRYYVDAARRAGELRTIGAMVLVDMIGDRDLRVAREPGSTRWLTDLIWDAARTAGFAQAFPETEVPIEDDHLPFLAAGIPATDLIDFDYPAWHTPDDTLDQISARSLETVGRVVVDALPAIERRILAGSGRR
jgi:glutaminyl-peptide cyclotransferase